MGDPTDVVGGDDTVMGDFVVGDDAVDMRTSDKYGPDENGVWQKAANGVVDYDDGHNQASYLTDSCPHGATGYAG